jgi:hypothetical protein
MTFRSERREHPSVTEARRLAGLPRRAPTESDRPPVRAMPSKPPKLPPGQLQLDLDGNDGHAEE